VSRFRAPPPLRIPLPRADTVARIYVQDFLVRRLSSIRQRNGVGRDVAWEMGCDDANQIARIPTACSTRTRQVRRLACNSKTAVPS